MGINYNTIKFKEDLTALINNSKLPAINVMLVLDATRAEVAVLLEEAVEDESKENTEE